MKKRRSIFTFLLLSIFVITAISSIVISFNIINTGKEITNKLEKEQLSLDESVKLFEEGIELSKKCDSKLEDAEKRITILINKDNEIKEENFSPEE